MDRLLTEQPPPSPAEQKIERFARLFGEPHLMLARHASLPLVLSPELLNYLRTEFLLDQTGWVAEADLLLSDLCREVGYETFAMDPDVRTILREELRADRVLGERRMQEIARRVNNYLKHLLAADPSSYENLKAQRWEAMVYLPELREAVVAEIAESLLLAGESSRGFGDAESMANWAEMVRLSALIREMSPQLEEEHVQLVEYARLATEVADYRIGLLSARELQSSLLARDFEILGRKLIRPDELLDRVEFERLRRSKRPGRKSRKAGERLIIGEIVRGTIQPSETTRIIRGPERSYHPLRIVVDLGRAGKGIAPVTDFLFNGSYIGDGSPGAYEDLVDVEFDFIVTAPPDADGFYSVSRTNAVRETTWRGIEEATSVGDLLIGLITDQTRRSLLVQMGEVSTRLLKQEYADRPPKNFETVLGRETIMQVTDWDEVESILMISRKAALARDLNLRKQRLFRELRPDDLVEGRVKRFARNQVLVDLGGIDGIVPNHETSWQSPSSPKVLFKTGERIPLKIIEIDPQRQRIELSCKQLTPDPWQTVENRYRISQTVAGPVTRVTANGAFVEIEPGVEAMIHVSDIDWKTRPDPFKFFKKGQQVQAAIMQINAAERRMGLSIKHLTEPPRSSFKGESFSFETVTLDETGKEIERRTLTARQFEEDLGEGVKLEMVEIPAGKFLMGSPKSEKERLDREGPQHEVTVEPFYIGKFTITQEQWLIVAGWPKVERDLKPDPSQFKGNRRPVEKVSWEHAKEFCARLSKKTGRAYRLPSEAEWEYACRAGTTTPFAFGETITHETVNYWSENPYAKAPKKKQRGETIPVGSLGVANAFGLYDMHGNVWEWCEDVWHEDYKKDAPTDGSAWLSGGDSTYRMLRGGSCVNYGWYCRSAYRDWYEAGNHNYDFGFRVCVSARTG